MNQRLLTTNPTGDYGPGAVGISAFSPVLVNWPQGGPIAIHGTNAPDMMGFAVSHGCSGSATRTSACSWAWPRRERRSRSGCERAGPEFAQGADDGVGEGERLGVGWVVPVRVGDHAHPGCGSSADAVG